MSTPSDLLIKTTVWWSDLGVLMIYCNICMCVFCRMLFTSLGGYFAYFLGSLISSYITPRVWCRMIDLTFISTHYFINEQNCTELRRYEIIVHVYFQLLLKPTPCVSFIAPNVQLRSNQFNLIKFNQTLLVPRRQF